MRHGVTLLELLLVIVLLGVVLGLLAQASVGHERLQRDQHAREARLRAADQALAILAASWDRLRPRRATSPTARLQTLRSRSRPSSRAASAAQPRATRSGCRGRRRRRASRSPRTPQPRRSATRAHLRRRGRPRALDHPHCDLPLARRSRVCLGDKRPRVHLGAGLGSSSDAPRARPPGASSAVRSVSERRPAVVSRTARVGSEGPALRRRSTGERAILCVRRGSIAHRNPVCLLRQSRPAARHSGRQHRSHPANGRRCSAVGCFGFTAPQRRVSACALTSRRTAAWR